MAARRQYLCNLKCPMNISCRWYLPIRLGSSLRSRSSGLLKPAQLFLFGRGIYLKRFTGWMYLGCLCKEDLLVYPFFVFLCLKILSESWFVKARIRKCLLAFIRQEGAGSSKKHQSPLTLLAFLHLWRDLKVSWAFFRLEISFWASQEFGANIWLTRHCWVFLKGPSRPKFESSLHKIICCFWELA